MPYQTPTYQLLKELSVNENVGVHAREVEQRRQRFGANVFEEVRRASIARLFLEQVKDPMILILCAAVLISLVFAGSGRCGDHPAGDRAQCAHRRAAAIPQ